MASLTLLTTLLDFSDAGEIGYFVDEASVAAREASIGKGGLLRGSELASVFSALRANDLIWQYVVGNYLKGGKPPAFDLLYWNADATNLPGPFARLVPAQPLSREQPARAGQAGDVRRQGRSRPASTCRPSSTPAARTTSCRGRPPISRRGLLGGETTFVLGASRPYRRRHQSAGEEQAQPLAQRQHEPPMPTNGWPPPPRSRAAGGRSGRSGSSASPAAKCRRADGWAARPITPVEPAPGRYVKEKA